MSKTKTPAMSTSEEYQAQQRRHFMDRINWSLAYRMTPEEKQRLNTAIRNHPCKNHSPCNQG